MHGPTNAGGGVSTKGFIQATYPEGSICTCTNGTRTLKARDTSGYMMFILPAIGKWTVTATDPADPTNTDSETVEITKEGETVSVELNYRLYLIKDGVLQEGLSIATHGANVSATATDGDGFITLYVAGWVNGVGRAAFYLTPKIDLTRFSEISIEYASQSPGGAGYAQLQNSMGVRTLSSNEVNTSLYAAYVLCPSNEKTTASVDVNSISGDTYYICMSVFGVDTRVSNKMDVYNLWLE